MSETKPGFPIQIPKNIAYRTEIAQVINKIITPELLLLNLTRLQEPAAPSGTEMLTRTPVLKEMLFETGVKRIDFEENFVGSESPALWMDGRKRVVANFQLDDISYMPRTRTNEITVPLRANCAHRQMKNLSFNAAVLRYMVGSGSYEYVSTGQINTDDEANPYYEASTKPRNGFDPVIDRIVYAPGVNFNPETNLVATKIDGPASVAAAVSAVQALQEAKKYMHLMDLNFGMVFAGEEEGVPGDNTMFSHGARMIVSNLGTKMLPEMVLIVDGHDIDQLPPTAMWGEQVSDCKGKVVAPHHAAPFRDFLEELEQYGVQTANTWEVGGTLSRSDDVAWRTRVKNVVPFGYAGRDYHFVRDIPATNIYSLVNLAKGIAWIAVSSRNP